MLYWRRSLAVVRGCQAPKRISAKPGGARKRARLGYTERSCTSGLYSGSELRPILRRAKHVGVWLADARSVLELILECAVTLSQQRAFTAYLNNGVLWK